MRVVLMVVVLLGCLPSFAGAADWPPERVVKWDAIGKAVLAAAEQERARGLSLPSLLAWSMRVV